MLNNLFCLVISGQIRCFPFVPEVRRLLHHSHYFDPLTLDGSMYSGNGSVACLLELNKYHNKREKRFLPWYLRRNRHGAGTVHLFGVNYFHVWIHACLTQVKRLIGFYPFSVQPLAEDWCRAQQFHALVCSNVLPHKISAGLGVVSSCRVVEGT